MAELGEGRGSSYPEEIDADDALERDKMTWARAAVPNDLADAIIKIETELGKNPRGSAADVAARLAAFAADLAAIPAADIAITDAGGFYTSTDVEAALQELAAASWLIGRLEAASAEPWAQQFNNLLKNGSFESWSPGANATDGWTPFGAGVTIARQAAIVRFGEYSASITRAAADCYLYQQILTGIDVNTHTYWRGRTVTLGCWVYATVADRARITIFDGIGSTSSTLNDGDSDWDFETVTHTIAANATELTVRIEVITAPTAVYYDGAILVEGTIAPTFAQHPNDEHLKAIDYQDTTPTNYDYGLLRMECGKARAVFSDVNTCLVTVTFGTAFLKILSVVFTKNAAHTINGNAADWSAHSKVTWNTWAVANNTFEIRYTDYVNSPFIAGDYVEGYWIAIGVE